MDRERDLPLRRPGGRDRRPVDQGPDDQPGDQPSDQPSDQDDEDAERSRPAGLHGGEHTPPAPAVEPAPGPFAAAGQSTTAIASTSTTRSGWASLRTSTVVLVGSAPKYSMRTSTCLKNSSMSVT